MRASFKVLGEPSGKGRPRFARVGGGVRTYTPQKTASYENLVTIEYERQCGDVFFGKGVAIRMDVLAVFGIPKSTSKKKASEMLNGGIRPVKKPDSSNIVKCLEDALNKVAYYDDAQIVETTVSRVYGENPRVEVVLENITGVE